MASEYRIVIDGVTMPTPSALSLDDYDISSPKTGRNANGKMIIETVRKNVHKLTCTWNALTPEQYMTLRKAISGVSDMETTYFIPEKNKRGTIKTYRGDRVTPVYSYAIGGRPIYKDVSLELIEV